MKASTPGTVRAPSPRVLARARTGASVQLGSSGHRPGPCRARSAVQGALGGGGPGRAGEAGVQVGWPRSTRSGEETGAESARGPRLGRRRHCAGAAVQVAGDREVPGEDVRPVLQARGQLLDLRRGSRPCGRRCGRRRVRRTARCTGCRRPAVPCGRGGGRGPRVDVEQGQLLAALGEFGRPGPVGGRRAPVGLRRPPPMYPSRRSRRGCAAYARGRGRHGSAR